MARISFEDRTIERKALAFLLGRFSGRVLAGGEHHVPEAALEALAEQGIPFKVLGKAAMSSKLRRFEVLLPLQCNDGGGRCLPSAWLTPCRWLFVLAGSATKRNFG